MDDSTQIEFRVCPHCAGYGVRDNGKNCKTCGGVGSGGLRSGGIGSGEIMVDKATRRQISLREFTEYQTRKAGGDHG